MGHSLQAKRVLIVDAHPLFRDGLKGLLAPRPDLVVAGEASTAEEAAQAAGRLGPDVICLDLSLAGAPGYALITSLLGLSPACPILAVAPAHRSEAVVQAFRAGALGYVVKTSRSHTFLEGIHSVLQGNFFVDATVANEVMHLLVSPDQGAGRGYPGYETLTGRELDVMRLIAEGVSTVNIAKRLSISPRTVESHRSNLMRKLGVSSMVDIVRHAVRLELVDPRDWRL